MKLFVGKNTTNQYRFGGFKALVLVAAACLLIIPQEIRASDVGSPLAKASGQIETEKITVSAPIISTKVSIDSIAASSSLGSSSAMSKATSKRSSQRSSMASLGEPVGMIDKIYVSDGERVSKGQTLMRVSDKILKLKVAKSEAALEQAHANREILDEKENELRDGLKKIKDGIAKMQSGISQMKQQEKELESAIAAMKMMPAGASPSTIPGGSLPGMSSGMPQTPEEMQKLLDQLRAQRKRLESQLKKIKSKKSEAASALDTFGSNKKAADAAIRIAEVNLDMSRRELEKATVVAPASGLVVKQNVREGEVIFPNQPLSIIAKTKMVTLTLYLPEDEARLIKKGQAAIITIDSYPNRKFKSVVNRVASAVEIAPTNLATERTHLAHTQKVTIEIENEGNIFKDGMPADAEILR